jgi:hypothetical protein
MFGELDYEPGHEYCHFNHVSKDGIRRIRLGKGIGDVQLLQQQQQQDFTYSAHHSHLPLPKSACYSKSTTSMNSNGTSAAIVSRPRQIPKNQESQTSGRTCCTCCTCWSTGESAKIQATSYRKEALA